jgi:hypothetical protein
VNRKTWNGHTGELLECLPARAVKIIFDGNQPGKSAGKISHRLDHVICIPQYRGFKPKNLRKI